MSYSLTALQLELMKELWSRGEASVLELHDALRAARPIAQSTVATLLSRLEKRGLVAHRVDGRQYFYRALVQEPQVRRSVMAEFSELAGRLFEGDVAAMVSHLLADKDVEPAELSRIRAMIEAREAELKGGER
jgi:predicted transcriptional regulator